MFLSFENGREVVLINLLQVTTIAPTSQGTQLVVRNGEVVRKVNVAEPYETVRDKIKDSAAFGRDIIVFGPPAAPTV